MSNILTVPQALQDFPSVVEYTIIKEEDGVLTLHVSQGLNTLRKEPVMFIREVVGGRPKRWCFNTFFLSYETFHMEEVYTSDVANHIKAMKRFYRVHRNGVKLLLLHQRLGMS